MDLNSSPTMRWSQEELAAELGISQQLQKHDVGNNWIGASRLFECSGSSDVAVSLLFEGLDNPELAARSAQAKLRQLTGIARAFHSFCASGRERKRACPSL
jgi:hypothetical protein